MSPLDRAEIRLRAARVRCRSGEGRAGAAGRLARVDLPVCALPHLPGRIAARVHVVEDALIRERVHALPEAGRAVGDELALGDEPLEWLLHELLAWLDVVEDLALEREETAVDPEFRLADVPDLVDESGGVRRDDVERLARADAQEARDAIA